LRDGGHERVVAGLHGDVDGARGEVVGPHGVPAEDGRLPHRDVVLVVRAAPLDVREGAVPAALDEERRLAHVARLVEGAPELRERHLDLRVAAHPLAAVRPERLAPAAGPCPRAPWRPSGPDVSRAWAAGRRATSTSRASGCPVRARATAACMRCPWT